MTMSKKSSTPSTSSTTTPAPAAPPPTDPNAALAALAQQAVAELDAIDASLGTDPPLSAVQKRHAARMRKGGPGILATIAALTTQRDLAPPATPVAAMTTQAGTASALQPLATRLARLTQHVNDLVFTAQSGAWVSATKFYAILQREAPSDPSLAAALQPVTQFFAYRHPTAKTPGTPTKPQKKATTKAVNTLKKNAPELLADPATPATPATPSTAETPSASPATPIAPAAAPPKS